MIVNINNATVTSKDKVITDRNAYEERDSGKVVVESTKSSRYETYDHVDITTPHGTEQFVVQADQVTQLNQTIYEHVITLIENIAYFDTIYPADRSFRVLGQTVEDLLEVYRQELQNYHGIEISWNLSAKSLNTTVPFKEFSGNNNFSQILQSIFRAIWAVPKVTRVANNVWEIYAQYHYNKETLIPTDTTSKTWQQNNIDYATRVKSQLKNAVNENARVWFPSETGYVLPRSTTLQKTSSKLRYELDSPIIAIDKALVLEIDYRVYNPSTSTYELRTNQTIDITSQVVQEDVWDNLDVTTETNGIAIGLTDNVKNHIQYQSGERFITNLFEADTDTLIFINVNTTFLLNALYRAVYKLVDAEEGVEPRYGRVLKRGLSTDHCFENLTIGVTETTFKDTDKFKMRFRYVRRRDMDVVHSRKTQGNMNYATTVHTQRDSSIEAGQYLRNLKFYSNRMGNNVYSNGLLFENNAEPYRVFDYTAENDIVTRVRNTYHSNDRIFCEFEVSENFANIEAEYALKRSSDPYTITGKSVTTNLVLEEYIEFSETNKDDSSQLTSVGKRLSLGLFENGTVPHAPLAVGVFKPSLPSWNDTHAIHMPLDITANGNAIAMHAYFNHQNIAGKIYYNRETSTYEDFLNPLAYTDEDGRLGEFQLYFAKDVAFNDDGEYPLILDETPYLVENHTTSDIVEPIDLDSNAAFAYTYVISFVADDHIGIGDKLARDNYLFDDNQSATNIKIYSSTKPYGQYDNDPRAYDTDVTTSVAYNYNYTTQVITITPDTALDYFSIVKDDEILLWFNKHLNALETYTVNINNLISIYFEPLTTIDISNSATASITIATLQASNQVLSRTITATGSTTITTIQQLSQIFNTTQSATGSTTITTLQALNLTYSAPTQSATGSTSIATIQQLSQIFSATQVATGSTSIATTQQLNQMFSTTQSATGSTSIIYNIVV